jgi:hypothetical protein
MLEIMGRIIMRGFRYVPVRDHSVEGVLKKTGIKVVYSFGRNAPSADILEAARMMKSSYGMNVHAWSPTPLSDPIKSIF